MSDSNDKSNKFREYRFNFHSSFAAANSGLSAEYVHSKILGPTVDLLKKTYKAATLNPSEMNQLALSTLQQLEDDVLVSLKSNSVEEHKVSQASFGL